MGTITSSVHLQQNANHTFSGKICVGDNAVTFQAVPLSEVEKDSPFAQYVREIERGNLLYCCDVEPINGINQTNRFIENLITREINSDLANQLDLLSTTSQQVNLFVLDIKDAKKRYENREEIEQCELAMAQFLQAEHPPKPKQMRSFHRLVRENHIQYLLREGLLKHDILQKLSPELRQHFQETPEGRGQLCQLCEIVMNFFKMGYSVRVLGDHVLHPEDYFLSTRVQEGLSSSRISLEKTRKIALKTLYPKFYAELYSQSSEYFSVINQIFKGEFTYDEKTGTTIISITQ
ncbi:MAG: hypothetical protein KR126chlam3_00066 [Chlamydiae bacterium]|nr:hypothetical protein [Chlamydiota bacterium]